MLRNGHVSVTSGADQQPPAFIFMRHRINDSLLGAVDNHRYHPLLHGDGHLRMSIAPRGLSSDRDKTSRHMMVV